MPAVHRTTPVANLNPYTPPTQAPQAIPRGSRLRAIPATGSFLFGFASFAMGVFASGWMLYSIYGPANATFYPGMLVGCAVYLAFGASWMLAGWFYWLRRYRHGLIANSVGLLFPIPLLLAVSAF